MNYFVDSFTGNYSNWESFANQDSTATLFNRYHVVDTWGTGYGSTSTIKSRLEGLAYTLSFIRYASQDRFSRVLIDNISSGEFPDTQDDPTIEYGEVETPDVAAMSFYQGGKLSRTICVWSDNDGDYTFHVYDGNGYHYSSFASNNPNLINPSTASFSFPCAKDITLSSAVRGLNMFSNNYILQPVVAFGVKTPMFLITGANGGDAPIFAEIQIGNKTFFTVSNEYAIEIPGE